jgi:hypothetical protein
MTRIEELSAYRLNGEEVPRDLAVLVPYADELDRRSGLRFAFEREWAPWADNSYLTECALSRADVRANIKANEMVFPYVAFFAGSRDGEYLGYWRGPSMRPIARTPLVWLDNEGQYSRLPGTVTVGRAIADNSAERVRFWLESLDVGTHEERIIDAVDDEPDPNGLRDKLFWKFMSLSS